MKNYKWREITEKIIGAAYIIMMKSWGFMLPILSLMEKSFSKLKQ